MLAINYSKNYKCTILCLAVDPCANHNCHAYASCVPQGYRYQCRCNKGYVGNGVDCKGKDLRILHFYK